MNPDPGQNRPLRSPANTRSQVLGVWGGVIGTAIGCSTWLIALAGLGHDWMAVGITLFFDLVMVVIFGNLCMRYPRKRLLLLAGMLILIMAHCLSMYWWRFDIWRAGAQVDAAVLVKEKKMVTITVLSMVAILLFQFVLFYWLQGRSRKNRAKMSS